VSDNIEGNTMDGALTKSLRKGTRSLEPVKNDSITSTLDLTAAWLGSFIMASSQEFAVWKDMVEEGKINPPEAN
jgi:hypothetical protein